MIHLRRIRIAREAIRSATETQERCRRALADPRLSEPERQALELELYDAAQEAENAERFLMEFAR